MSPAQDRPHCVSGAGTMDEEGAAMIVSRKVAHLFHPGRGMAARPGAVPFMPLQGSPSKRHGLLGRERAFDELRQGVGFGNAHRDMKPATVAASRFAVNDESILAPQLLQPACDGLI